MAVNAAIPEDVECAYFAKSNLAIISFKTDVVGLEYLS